MEQDTWKDMESGSLHGLTCKYDFSGDKNQQHHLRGLHAVNEAREQLWLVLEQRFPSAKV